MFRVRFDTHFAYFIITQNQTLCAQETNCEEETEIVQASTEREG